MGTITIEQLRTLREKEDHIEFKEAKHRFPFAGGERTEAKERRRCLLGYIVALANERGGKLILGMTDKFPHEVVGTDFALNNVKNLEDEIYKRLHIRVHNEELFEDNLRVLVINVPSRPIGKALRFEGVPLMRTGESLREMDDAEYFAVLSEQDPDFSAKICVGLTPKELDKKAIEKMRKLISAKRNNSDFLTLPLNQILSDLNLYTQEKKLTYAALVLLGTSQAIQKYLPQYNVVVEYRTAHDLARYTARKEFREPLFIAIDNVWNYINQPASNPLLHINALPIVLDIPAFNEETTREAVLNACIHRSLQLAGDTLIRQYPDYIEFINPGGFPYGVNISNILTVTSSPRNRLIAETLEKTGLIERSGQGADVMFSNCIREGKPLPDYSDSDDYQVCLRISAEIENPNLFLFLQNSKTAWNAFELLNLYNINRGDLENLFQSSLKRLIKEQVIAEDSYFKYTLGNKYFSHIYGQRTEMFGTETIRLIYYAIKEKGKQAPSSTIIKKLNGLYTPKQVRNIIDKMVNVGWLSKKGNGRGTTYSWVE